VPETAWKWIAVTLASALLSGAGTLWASGTDSYTKAEVEARLALFVELRDDVRDLIARLEERGVIARRKR